jgi:hypothetical protein
MRIYLTLALIIAIIAPLAGGGLYLYWLGGKNAKETHKSSANSILPAGTQSRVVIKDGKVWLYQLGKEPIELRLPKTQQLRLDIDTEGRVSVEKPTFLPSLCLKPHMGIAYAGRTEPLVGLQLVRLEPLQLGLSCDITPSLTGLSLNYDLFQNALIGLGIGTDWDADNKYYIFFGLHF